MGAMEVERLVMKSAFVKESLARSDTMTAEMINILGSFDEQLSSLEAAMRPTQVTALRRCAHWEEKDQFLPAS
jgi:hypothetical protein